MSLLSVLRAELAFGMTPLLDMASISVLEGERIGFIGRNGSGKSSLLAAMAGRLALDGGEVRRRDGLRVVLVEQEPALPLAASLRASLAARGGLRAADLEGDDWRSTARLQEFLQRFDLDGAIDPQQCSGGERKRAALALAFASQADILLLDEPTNHLDLDGIETLENLLIDEQRGQRAAIIITHDRRFLDRVATRIIELDRGALQSYPGNFAAYESRKALAMQSEALERRRFDRFWTQEEAWIRKGVEARRTRNEGRVRRLERLRAQREQRRERLGSVSMGVAPGERSGRMVAELEGVSKSFGVRAIVRDLSLRLMRGDRLALIGPNGAGKSTLLKLILGQIAPDAGTVRGGTRREIAFFDQQREALDPDKTLIETISPGSDWIEIGSSRKHVIAYLGEFLFPPRRTEAPVRTLSGGERNRLLLARLFARPANLLVLDEPTNDLDMETLELLEATLADYEGTLLLVSHDRRFLDNLATQCLVAEGNGLWKEYVGGYSDWLRQRAPPPRAEPTAAAEQDGEDGAGRQARPLAQRAAKLGFNERRELESLPGLIASLEQELAAMQERMARADYHRQGPEQIRSDRARSQQIEVLLEEKLRRWVELDARRPA
ncbi:ABC transporter ATP-binding protein uup-1 [Burkholderiales bacterium]|nr:ABC transporter ATP-binding protein uup-1 [Burkholderiales bacterium]